MTFIRVSVIRGVTHINQEPPSDNTFLAILEGSIDVFLSMAVTKRQPDPGEDNLLVSSRGIKVSK
jgi:hypothetical protein